MSTIKNVVAATDFSDVSRHAVQRAAVLAAEQHAQLMLVHVMSGPSLESLRQLFPSIVDAEIRLTEDVQRLLSELAAELCNAVGVTPDTRVRIGRVVDEILCESDPADLLVLGARGSNPLRDLILGTTAERLLRKRRQPALVVRRPPQDGYRRVLIPVDFTPHSATALRMAMRIAPQAEYTVFHAFDVPFEGKLWLAGVPDEQIDGYRNQARQFSLNTINELIREVGGDPHRFQPAVKLGEASPLILASEAELGADLIVIGKHSRSMVEELLLGSVARHVLSTAQCDVLVV